MAQERTRKETKGGVTASKRKSSRRIEDDIESELGTRWYMPKGNLVFFSERVKKQSES